MVQKGIDDLYYSRTWTHRVEQQKRSHAADAT